MPRLLLFAAALVAALPAAAQTLVVGNKGEDTVSFIDLATGRTRALPTGKAPHEVAISPDAAQAAVVAYGSTTIDIFTVAPPALVRRIDLAPNSRPHGLQWLEDGRLVATTEGSDTLTIVDPKAGRVLSSIPTGQKGSHMVVVSPDARLAFVSNLQSKTVSVIDLAARKKLRDLVAGDEPEGIALTPDGRELWVANRAGNEVVVFSTADYRILARVKVGSFPIRIAISPDGRTAVTSNHKAGDLTVIDVARRAVTRTVKVSGEAEALQVTILFAPIGNTIYVAETGFGRIAEVDLGTGLVRGRLGAGTGSDGLGMGRAAAP